MSEELRVGELEAEVAQLRALRRLGGEADDILEEAQRDRLPLEKTMQRMLPVLLGATGASSVLVNTFDEALALRDFMVERRTSPSPLLSFARSPMAAAPSSRSARVAPSSRSASTSRESSSGSRRSPSRPGARRPRSTSLGSASTPGRRSSIITSRRSRSLERRPRSLGSSERRCTRPSSTMASRRPSASCR